jgi:chromosomal replication initiator protein
MQPESISLATRSANAVAEILDALETRIGQRNFDLWFSEKAQLSIAADHLLVDVQSPFELTWLQRQFGTELSQAAQVALGPSAQIEYRVRPRTEQAGGEPSPVAAAADSPALPAKDEVSRTGSASRGEKSREANVELPAARKRTLVDFVAGPENELAYRAALRIVEQPGMRYNPLVIYGDVGLGKTHLVEGIYWAVRRTHSRLNVFRTTAETFANYFTHALSQRKLPEFRFKMRSVDMLLLDNIDFFDGKKVIQEEFLHTLKVLEEAGKQIMLTSDRHPRLMLKTREELTSRLASGMLCRLESPGEETRRKIVGFRMRQMGLNFSEEIQAYIAQRFQRSVRELEGALNCLDHFSDLSGHPLTLSQTRTLLAGLERDCRRIIHLSDIERCVCRYFGLQSDELKSSSKARTVSHPRMLAMFLARRLTESPYSAIGNYFGGRRHSTVKSAEQKVQTWLDENRPLQLASREWTLGDVLGSLERELQAC